MKTYGIDHVEFYVGDLQLWADHLCGAYAFEVCGHGGPQTGLTGQRSLLLRHGRAQVLLTTAQAPDHPAARYVRDHGDGVAVVALRTDNVRAAFTEAVAGGAHPLAGPEFAGSDSSRVGVAYVSGFGDVTHKLVERSGPADEFAPGTIEMTTPEPGAAGGLFEAIDHLAVCLPTGQLAAIARLYHEAFGLSETFDERIEVGGQAMLSKVVQDPTREVTFTLIEPDVSREPGQIDEFLAAHGGAGVQHVALRTTDIVSAVATTASRGVEFLTTPPGYYDLLQGRLGRLAVPVTQLKELNILADRDRWG
ncbi:MAG TPA: VOC family protein, partial [Streptosporangiaceae bacterium]|nr:VOC family protein [Streptosporangiaceae bacterium]